MQLWNINQKMMVISQPIYKQEGDLLIERLHIDCKTNPALDKKIIEDIIKSMTL